MRPMQTLASTTTTDGEELVLQSRGDDFFITLDGEELMSTRAPGSEEALAQLGCEGLAARERPRILIGGLGLGYTLRTSLEILPRSAEVVVAELFPAVVEWTRTHLRELDGGAIDDPRVRLLVRDVYDVLKDGPGPYDAILLDVDNGPEAWCLQANGRLYDRDGIEILRRAMAPKGRLAIWASQADPRYANRLRKRGFQVETRQIRTQGKKGNRRHVVFLASASPKSRLRVAPRAAGRK